MPIEKRTLLEDANGTWRLVFDRPAGHLFVEHESWTPLPGGAGRPRHDLASWSFGDLLESGPRPVAAALLALLEPIFPDPAPRPDGRG